MTAALTLRPADAPPAPLTASGLERALACLGSTALPRLRHANPFAAGGSRLHRFVELSRTMPAETAADLVVRELPEEDRDDERAFLIAIDLSAIPPGAESEVGFALSVRTGEVRRISGREAGYPEMGPEWILGTTDLVGMRSPSTAWVADLKRYIFRSRADSCAQTDFYALCGVRLSGADDAETMLMRPIASGWATDRAYRDSIALESFFDALAQLMEARHKARRVYLAGGPMALLERGMLSTGPQCELCDSRRACPAFRSQLEVFATLDLSALVAAVGPKFSEEAAIDLFKARALATLTAKEAEASQLAAEGDEAGALVSMEWIGQAYTAARLVALAAAGAKAAADEIARRTPIPLPNGMWRYEGTTTRSVPDEDARAQLANLKETLRDEGHIVKVTAPQMRTGKKPRGK